MGLNFVGAIGENVRIMRSKSRVTKLFVTCCTGRPEEEVRAWEWTLGGSAAAGAAMVEWGGLVIDPRRLHVEKPTE